MAHWIQVALERINARINLVDADCKKAVEEIEDILSESSEVLTESDSDYDPESESDSDYEPESESDSDSDYEPNEVLSEAAPEPLQRVQHCSFCGGPDTVTCYHRSIVLLEHLRLNTDALNDYAANM